MSYETHGVVRLRPDATWAQVLALYDTEADPAEHFFEPDPASSLVYDPEKHEIDYVLNCRHNDPSALEPFAQEGWVSYDEDETIRFLGPNHDQTALLYWTDQRNLAQAMMEHYARVL